MQVVRHVLLGHRREGGWCELSQRLVRVSMCACGDVDARDLCAHA
jgi:hypothetical protein